MHRHIALVLAALVFLPTVGAAQHVPNVRPTLNVRPAAGPIEIDGNLGDTGWAGTARALNWTETWPGDNLEPEIGHEAWMTYDEENLYFAILVTEDPEQVRASLRDRDEVWRDDYVGLIFDTFGTGAWAYELFINPRGVQMDLRWTPNGEDMGFDVVWDSEGKITENGWQVEIRVPFSSLRFPEGAEQEWRATFWHNRPRESRLRYSWSASDRDDPCWPCNWGTITGITGVNGAGAVDILPSLTAYDINGLEDTDDPTSDFTDLDEDVDMGVGIRYAISSSYAAEATINPDFSQVESDAAQIDANTTFALFFPERRPFFQEGSDLYSSWVNAIYTRSINNPLWAGKLTGRTETSSVALLVAQDEDTPLILPFEERSAFVALDKSRSLIFRTRSNLYRDSHAGMLFTMRELDAGGHNLVYGADTMLRFLGNYQLEAQWLLSETKEAVLPEYDSDLTGYFGEKKYTEALDGEFFGGQAGYLSIERHARHWSWDMDYWYTGDTFRADNGAIFQNDQQRFIAWTNYSWPLDNQLFDDITPFFMVGRIWNADGVRKDEWIRQELSVAFKSQTQVSGGVMTSNELFGGEQLNGIQRGDIGFDTHFSEFLSGHARYERGDFVARNASPVRLGDGQVLNVGLNIKPMDRVSIEPSYRYQKLEDPNDDTGLPDGFFEGYVARTRINVQMSRKLIGRLIFQYNSFSDRYDVEPLFTYRINPFTAIYAGGSRRFVDFSDSHDDFDIEQSQIQYFVKFQYLFRN